MTDTTIPGPKGRWLIGDMLDYDRDRLGWLLRTRDQFGDLVRLAPGAIVVHDPLSIRTILTSPKAVPGHTAMTGRRSLTASLPHWTELHGQVWRQLGRQVIAAHQARITSAFATQIKAFSGTHKEVFPFAADLCATATVDFCTGADGADPDLAEAAKAMSRSLIRVASTPEARVRWLPRPAAKESERASRHLQDLLLTRVRRRHDGGTDSDDLLSSLPLEMPANVAADVLRTVLMSSPGSPASAVSWALLRLSEHPQHAARVAEDDSFAVAFAKEVLRLHPPNWLIGRHTLAAMGLGSHVVPAGTSLLIPVYHVHRDARWWERPDEFDPSRWLTPAAPHAPHTYLPFGAGPNTCPGGHLAMAQIVAFVQVMARGYSLSLPALSEVTADPGALLLPAQLAGRWDPQ